MEERYLLFNSTWEDRRRLQASDLAWVFSNFLTSGVYHTNEVPGIKVITDGMGMSVTLTKGAAFVRGYPYDTTGRLSLTHDTADSQYDRIDRVVLRLDERRENRYIRAFIIKGLPGFEPVPPTLQRDGDIYEMSLAQVRVKRGMSVISQDDIKDERFDEEVCGLVSSLMTNKWDKELRNADGKLQFLNDGEWVTVMNAMALNPVSDFAGETYNSTVYLTWQDPEDLIADGRILSAWKGTRIVRKKSSQPVHENDGVIVVDTGVKNEFKENPFIDVSVEDNQVYYYAAFPYSTDNVFTIDESSVVQMTPLPFQIYGVKIDTTNSNPNTAVQRIENAVGLESPEDFENAFPFNKIRPCVIKEGVLNYYLDPNDYSKRNDGTPSDITTGDDGDAFIQIPRVWWKIERIGTDIFVRYADGKIDESYQALAHINHGGENDFLNIGIFAGSRPVALEALRSLSGKSAFTNASITTMRETAKRAGDSYEQLTFYSLTLLQILYIVKHKTLDSIEADEILGIEDLIHTTSGVGGIFIDGVVTNGDRAILAGTHDFENEETFTKIGYETGSNITGYISDTVGNTEGGFLGTATNGSSSTFFKEYVMRSANAACYLGRYRQSEPHGLFSAQLSFAKVGTGLNSLRGRLICYT